MLGLKILGFIALVLLNGRALSEYNLTIVHISDFHSHWFEFNEQERKCSEQESVAGKCFGGFPRLLTLVRDIRSKEKNVIVVSSGEFFLGRSLNALHGWKMANALLPLLDLDAMSLANHDFSSGVFELSAFLYGMKFPVLCANMCARETSFLYSRVNKSTVLDVNGEHIGIVGYLHPETLERSRKAASVNFYQEIPAIKEEVMRLEGLGVNKIIALGHSGYYTDLEIAKNVTGVDVVIGGNSDIVLEEPSDGINNVTAAGNIHGNYPRIHHHENDNDTESVLKKKSLVLHIPQHGKYVGVIRVTFDDKGNVVHEEGEPVLLDSSIPQDKEALRYLKDAHLVLEDVTRHSRLPDDDDVLAEAKHDFESRKCRIEECSLGNLVTDAMLQVYSENQDTKTPGNPEKWGHVDAVVFNSGSMRYLLPAGNITIKDLLHSLFVGDFMKRVRMSGEQLIKMMEHSVDKYDPTGVTSPGRFLQVSGLRVVYDTSKVTGNRVMKLAVRCRHCTDKFELVIPYKMYFVGMPGFIAKGGDGFPGYKEADPDDFGQPEILLIVQYLREKGEVEPILDGRISFLDGLFPGNSTSSELLKKGSFEEITSASLKEFTSRADKISISPSGIPISGTGKKNFTSSTIVKSINIEIEATSSIGPTNKGNKITYRSLVTPVSETKNSSSISSSLLMPASNKDNVNNSTVLTAAMLDDNKNDSITLVTSPYKTRKANCSSSITPRTKESVRNNSKEYYQELEKNYLYRSMMSGLERLPFFTSTEKTPKLQSYLSSFFPVDTFLNRNTSFVSNQTNEFIRNIDEENVPHSKEEEISNNVSPGARFEPNSEAYTVSKPESNPATSRALHSSALHDEKSKLQATEVTRIGNDTFGKSGSSSPKPDLSAVIPELIEEEFLVPDFEMEQDELYGFQKERHDTHDTTVNEPTEHLQLKNISNSVNLGESSLLNLTDSVQNVIERAVLDDILAKAKENVLHDVDLLRHKLKTELQNTLRKREDVATLAGVEYSSEVVTKMKNLKGILMESIRLYTTEGSREIDGTQASTASGNKVHIPVSFSVKSDNGSTVVGRGKQQRNNSEMTSTIANEERNTKPETSQVFNDSMEVSDSNQKRLESVMSLLVDAAVKTVLDNKESEVGHKWTASDFSDVGNNDTNKRTLKKRRVVKKQLGASNDEITPTNISDKLRSESPLFNLTLGSEGKTETDAELNSQNRAVSEMNQKEPNASVTTVSSQQNYSTVSTLSHEDRKKNEIDEEVEWMPWML